MQATFLHFLFGRKKEIYWFINLFLVFALSKPVFSQNNPEQGLPFITNYTAKTFNALPQAWSVIEDSRNFMYFGLQGTILEYDGVKWRKINQATGNSAAGVARSFAKDKKGRIYYGAVGDFGYLAQDSLGQTIAVSLLKYVPESKRQFFDVWTINAAAEGIYFQSREYIFRLNEKNEVKVWSPRNQIHVCFLL